MAKKIPYLNEIVSISVMLLMVVALVAGQVDAKIQQEVRAQYEVLHISHFRFEDE